MKKFPNSKLLFTDTDSLAYEVIGHDVYEGMSEMKEEFDFSEYSKDHPLYSRENMKTVGKFKDECMGQLMLKFIGLRPKLYSFDYERLAYFVIDDGMEKEVDEARSTFSKIVRMNKNTAKDVKDSVAKDLSLDDYETCLTTREQKEVNIKRVGSSSHKIYTYIYIYTYNTDKIGLSAFDTKRWICDDGIHTLAFGHWRTNEV